MDVDAATDGIDYLKHKHYPSRNVDDLAGIDCPPE